MLFSRLSDPPDLTPDSSRRKPTFASLPTPLLSVLCNEMGSEALQKNNLEKFLVYTHYWGPDLLVMCLMLIFQTSEARYSVYNEVVIYVSWILDLIWVGDNTFKVG